MVFKFVESFKEKRKTLKEIDLLLKHILSLDLNFTPRIWNGEICYLLGYYNHMDHPDEIIGREEQDGTISDYYDSRKFSKILYKLWEEDTIFKLEEFILKHV
jgi:hypothetical protein